MDKDKQPDDVEPDEDEDDPYAESNRMDIEWNRDWLYPDEYRQDDDEEE